MRCNLAYIASPAVTCDGQHRNRVQYYQQHHSPIALSCDPEQDTDIRFEHNVCEGEDL